MPVFPVLVTPLNAEAALGDNWRHIRDWALSHGVVVHQLGNRPAIVTTELLAAIQEHGAPGSDEPAVSTAETEAEKIRRQLGLRRRTS